MLNSPAVVLTGGNKMKNLNKVVLALALLLNACGAKSGLSIGNQPNDSNEYAVNSAEDASDAIVDGSGTSGSAKTLAPLAADVAETRTCSTTGGVTTVSSAFTGTATKTSERTKKDGTVVSTSTDIEEIGSEQRAWTPPTGQSISCTSATGKANIAWETTAVVNGLKGSFTIARTRTAKHTVSNSGTSFTRTDSAKVAGTRTVLWAATAAEVGATTVTRTKTVSYSVTRNKTITKKDGSSVTVNFATKTVDDKPLVVEVVRSITGTKAITFKTIKSGTIQVIADSDAGTIFESTFKDLKFDYSTSNKCQPVSGTITGTYVSTDGTGTYVITFESGKTPTIAYDVDTATDLEGYNTKGCDLEKEV